MDPNLRSASGSFVRPVGIQRSLRWTRNLRWPNRSPIVGGLSSGTVNRSRVLMGPRIEDQRPMGCGELHSFEAIAPVALGSALGAKPRRPCHFAQTGLRWTEGWFPARQATRDFEQSGSLFAAGSQRKR